MRRNIDVIPLGSNLFLIQFFGVDDIPASIEFDRYYNGECRIVTQDGVLRRHAGTVYRLKNRRNVVGERNTTWLVFLLETDMAHCQLVEATIELGSFGAELSSDEVKRQSRKVADQAAAQRRS